MFATRNPTPQKKKKKKKEVVDIVFGIPGF